MNVFIWVWVCREDGMIYLSNIKQDGEEEEKEEEEGRNKQKSVYFESRNCNLGQMDSGSSPNSVPAQE